MTTVTTRSLHAGRQNPAPRATGEYLMDYRRIGALGAHPHKIGANTLFTIEQIRVHL
jgi:hypothetical protein